MFTFLSSILSDPTNILMPADIRSLNTDHIPTAGNTDTSTPVTFPGYTRGKSWPTWNFLFSPFFWFRLRGCMSIADIILFTGAKTAFSNTFGPTQWIVRSYHVSRFGRYRWPNNYWLVVTDPDICSHWHVSKVMRKIPNLWTFSVCCSCAVHVDMQIIIVFYSNKLYLTNL
jgi:hypothetical protein